jgi:transposase
MALGQRRTEWQQELWVATAKLPVSIGHVFYDALNRVLRDGKFDEFAESLCEPYYKEGGRPGIPPGVYFRMVFVGYFEGIDSQRGIAWRCRDSLSLRKFLGYELNEKTPEHSSLTRIRQRLPLEVFEQLFAFVLSLVEEHGLLKGKTVGVDSTLLEANAAMKSIVRKDTGEDWEAYVRGLAEAEGVEINSKDDLRKFDRKCKGKKTSNKEWESPSDPDARIMKMKKGHTHLSYKQEHTVDLETEAILSVEIYYGSESDANTLLDSVGTAQGNLQQADSEAEIKEAVADKGYHKNETLAKCQANELRTYICEPDGPDRRWTDKPDEYESAYRANRRRLKGDRNKRLQKLRCERVERSFAHVCETGGARRTWLRGIENNRKKVRLTVAAHNLGLILRKLLGSGKPREFAGLRGLLFSSFRALQLATRQLCRTIRTTHSIDRLHFCCNQLSLHKTTISI